MSTTLAGGARRGLSGRGTGIGALAEDMWNGAATNDPRITASELVASAKRNLPGAVGTEGMIAGGRAASFAAGAVEQMRAAMDAQRVAPVAAHNAPLIQAQSAGFRTRPLTPYPPKVTTMEAVPETVRRLRDGAKMYVNWLGPKQALTTVGKGIARTLGGAAAAYQGVTGALEGAHKGLNTPTNEYQARTSIDNPTLARAVGVMGDVGDATTFGLAGRLGRKMATLWK